MEPGEPIQVDLDGLAEAMDSRMPEGIWLLDLSSGEVAHHSDDELSEDESLEDPELYLPINSIDSSLSFTIMEDFLGDLPEGISKNALAEALERRKPFRAFKDALLDFPDVREAWFKFHAECMVAMAEEWLKDNVPEAIPMRKGRAV